MLGELITAAQKKEQERTLLPLWLVHNVAQKVKGEEPLPFLEFMAAAGGGEESHFANDNKKNLTAEEIINEFAPFLTADELRRARNGRDI